jgi:enoyl-CoA hydratase/carnithine racemase
MDAANDPLACRIEAGVARLTLRRPAARNALDLELLGALRGALDTIAADPAARAVVVAAAGPAFSAGHDLREITRHRGDDDSGQRFYEETMALCSEVMQRITELPQPVIAAVEGVATAAGCQLVAACDLAVAGAQARFCTPGVAIGLFCSTPAVALSRAVGRKAAMEMLLTGEMIDAEEARRIGLVNRVVPAGEAEAEALRLASGIAARSAFAVQLGKRSFREQEGRPLGAAYACASRSMVENVMARDAAEGISAFLQKRAPVWEDR